MTVRIALIAGLIALGIGPSPVGAGALEELDPATAHAEITASEGVVFVDLWAEW